MRSVSIVGAGIGGLTAAIALRNQGYVVQVLEKVPELKPLGAGITLQVNAVSTLRSLGLYDAITRASVVAESMTFRQWHGEVQQVVDFSALSRTFGVPTLVTHRGWLQQVLLEALGRDCVRTGVNITSVRQKGVGAVVTLEDGTQLESDLVVGADGLRSFVREQLWGPEPLRYAGYTSWRGMCSGAEWVPPGKASEAMGEGQRFGYVYIGEGQVYWFATENGPAGGRDGNVQEELLRRFAGWHAPIASLIRATPPEAILRTDISDRPPRFPWGRGSITLLGDAAHPMTPNLGQGGCQAIEDAVVLASCLAEGWNGALRRYEERRHARTRAIVEGAFRLGTLVQGAQPWTRLIRDQVMPRIPRSLTQRQMQRMLRFEP